MPTYSTEDKKSVINGMVKDIQNKEREVNEQELYGSQNWKDAAQLAYEGLEGRPFDGSEEDLVKMGLDMASRFEYNLTGQALYLQRLKDATPEQKMGMYYLVDTYEKKDWTGDGVTRFLREMGMDATNYIFGAGIFTKAVAGSAIKKNAMGILKSGFEGAMKTKYGTAAMSGAAYTGAYDIMEQKLATDVGEEFPETGLPQEIDPGQTAAMMSVGAAVVPAILETPAAVGRGVKQVGKWAAEGAEEMSKMAGGGTPPEIKTIGNLQKDINKQIEKHGDLEELDYSMMDISDRDLTRIQRVKFTVDEIKSEGEDAVWTVPNLKEFLESYPDEFRYAQPKITPEIKNDKVKIYRSAIGEIEPGDWIGLNKNYAEAHSRTADHKVYEIWVDKEDIRWQGADANEWIYLPEEVIKNPPSFRKAK